MNDLTVPDSAPIVKELKTATGWDHIEFVQDSFVISFDMEHASVIKGLVQSRDCFSLEFESVKHLPLSFLVGMGGSTHQYWTVGGQQHRPNDLPAYVGVNPDENRIIRRWFWHGLLHRVGAPAKEIYNGYDVDWDIPTMEKHYKESWDNMQCEWWEEGFQCKYPSPFRATIEHGWRLRDKKTRKLDSPRDDLAAFGAQHVDIGWDASMIACNFEDTFIPSAIEFTNLCEYYNNGTMTSRDAEFADFVWQRNGQLLSADTGLLKFNDEVQKHMLQDLGLWAEPFYQSDDTEFLMASEYDRVGQSDND